MLTSTEIQQLDKQSAASELAKVVLERQLIGESLQKSPRNKRQELLEQHRQIKDVEYAVGERLAQLDLEQSIAGENPKKTAAAEKKLQRLQSRLNHSDWLLWTRSVWKFKDMESDAKKGKHPAQFSSKVPERLISMYSFRGETVLDPFLGTGTTSCVAKRLGRNSIGVDVNPIYIDLSHKNIAEIESSETKHKLILGDARKLSQIADESIQLVVAHPPYWNCIKISDLPNDLSNCDNNSYAQFLHELRRVAVECFRVLEADRIAAFMIGDVMRKVDGITRLYPIHSDFMTIAQDIGFLPWDVFIVETKMRDSGGMPMMGSYPYPHKLFSQFAHNYIVVMRKPLGASKQTIET